MSSSPEYAPTRDGPSPRAVLRVVAIAVLSGLALYLLYLLRVQLGYLVLAGPCLSPLPLAVVMGLADLVPLVGATIGAVLVGVVTLFTDFPTATIIWAVFAIAYQQFENYVVQPRIQSRAAKLDPFIVVVAAIFGGALLGVIGALLAIPTAAVIQVAVHEYLSYRRDARLELDGPPAQAPPPSSEPRWAPGSVA